MCQEREEEEEEEDEEEEDCPPFSMGWLAEREPCAGMQSPGAQEQETIK